MTSSHGTIQFTPPVAYQVMDGLRYEVDASYKVHDNEYSFAVENYNRALPLVIDPLLSSTYLGGSSNETTYAMGIYRGDIIVAGTADSTDFPGLDEDINILGDAFIVRLDPDLSIVRAATYFGGSMTEGIRDIAVGEDSIYAAGYNNSLNFPTTPGAAYSGTSLTGAFVVKMDPATLRITAATSFHPNVFGLAWSPAGKEVYIAGSTGTIDFPISGGNTPAFQLTHKGAADSFVAVFDEDLAVLKGATLLGGEGFDIAYDLTVDNRGYPIVAGVTNSAAFPVSDNAFGPAYNLDWEATHQWIDGFVARLTPDLSGLESATYLGGGFNDNITSVAAEGSLILVGGNTASTDFPCGSTFGPIDGNDAFVVLFNEDLSSMRSCTVFGGSRPGSDSPESVSDVAFHPSGSIFAVGRTNARDFPATPGAFLSEPSGSYFGAFIIAFNGDLSEVEASSLVHGGGEDLKAVVLDIWGDVVVAGDSSGSGYPVTTGALQSDHAGGDDLVISRLTPDLTGPHIELVPVTLDFGHLPVGRSGQEKIVIHNTGGAELKIRDIQVTPETSAAFSVENTCFIVPAFGSCSIDVVFKPLLSGSAKGDLVIYSDDHFRNQVAVLLLGRAIKSADISGNEDLTITKTEDLSPRMVVTPNLVEFGEVEKGLKLTRNIRVINAGSVDLYLNKLVLDPGGKGPFKIGKESCSGAVLEAGSGDSDSPPFCEVRIVFNPDKIGNLRARLQLSSSGPLPVVHTVMITGSGVDPENQDYHGFWGWIAILVLVLRIVLRLPVSAGGWGRWMNKRDKR